MKLINGIYLFFAIIFIFACKNDKNQDLQNSLYGKWNVVSATRNDKATETINGAYFKFNENNTLATNLTGHDMTNPYTFKNGKLTTEGEQAIVYALENANDSTLQVTFEMQGFQFKLHLQRDTSSLVPAPDSLNAQPVQ